MCIVVQLSFETFAVIFYFRVPENIVLVNMDMNATLHATLLIYFHDRIRMLTKIHNVRPRLSLIGSCVSVQATTTVKAVCGHFLCVFV